MRRTPEEEQAWEFHRWQGFTRFSAGADGALTARIAPSCDILEGLAEYFFRRLQGRGWTLIDERRGKAAVCQASGHWRVIAWSSEVPSGVLPDETEELWKTYCRSITIRERKNAGLQKQHIPSRYRPYLPECNDMNQ